MLQHIRSTSLSKQKQAHVGIDPQKMGMTYHSNFVPFYQACLVFVCLLSRQEGCLIWRRLYYDGTITL